jgi:hypothetical protein
VEVVESYFNVLSLNSPGRTSSKDSDNIASSKSHCH